MTMRAATWLASVLRCVEADGPLVRIAVVRAEGSTPREAGAAMLVTARATFDTIGGGQLELEAIAHARQLLGSTEVGPGWQRDVRDFALGPSLGQCCGGATKLLFEVFTRREAAAMRRMLETAADASHALVVRPVRAGDAPVLLADRKQVVDSVPLPVLRSARDMLSGARPRGACLAGGPKSGGAWFIEPAGRERLPLFVYGAGHVGRALVHVLAGLPFAVTWVDTSRDRFPEPVDAEVTVAVVGDVAGFAAQAPAGAAHIVLTYSHALDLAICFALLKRADCRFLGLIGSATKRARFHKRLREAGIAAAALERLTCPIGIDGLPGKEPAVIAVGVAAQLLGLLQQRTTTRLQGEAVQ